MRRYSATGVTPVGTTLPIINISGNTTVRGRIFDLIVSSDSAPADVATRFQVGRTTSVGTGGTAITARALDPADPVSLMAPIAGTFSGAPTFTANSDMLNFALNQRATFRWVAVPDSELVIIANATNGIELLSVSSSGTPNCDATILWQE